jgi:TonB family protein
MAVNSVRITPKKKTLRITIDREQVVKAKKEKDGKTTQDAHAANGKTTQDIHAASGKTAAPTSTDDSKTETAAAPAAEQPADAVSVTTTTSTAHATRVLRDALGNVLAPRLDVRMVAAMPDFWQPYYKAAAAKTDYQPNDPAVLRQNAVDHKAQLISHLEADSNDYAQHAGVAGVALYHVVVGSDGTAAEIAVARPIGFGLDENAVAAIRKAKFDPAMKDGKPVPVLLDLVVEFRIYSNRTEAESTDAAAPEKPTEPSRPGPYSASHPQ